MKSMVREPGPDLHIPSQVSATTGKEPRMDIGEQERVIIVEPLEAPDPLEPDVVPAEPERESESEPAEEPVE
jgi:hypothetical protein